MLEADLGEEPPEQWVALARERDAELLWLHTNADLAAQGFERFPGYVRLRAESPPRGEPIRHLRREHFAATQDAAFRGLWGHKLVSPDAEPPAGSVVLGQYQGEDPIGAGSTSSRGETIPRSSPRTGSSGSPWSSA